MSQLLIRETPAVKDLFNHNVLRRILSPIHRLILCLFKRLIDLVWVSFKLLVAFTFLDIQVYLPSQKEVCFSIHELVNLILLAFHLWLGDYLLLLVQKVGVFHELRVTLSQSHKFLKDVNWQAVEGEKSLDTKVDLREMSLLEVVFVTEGLVHHGPDLLDNLKILMSQNVS